MSRVLPGIPPHITAQPRADLTPAAAWIEAHYDEFRGQWVAVIAVESEASTRPKG